MIKNLTSARNNLIGILIILLVPAVLFCDKKSSPTSSENDWLPITEQVNGELSTVDGIDILKLWGTPTEQGYAYGYLLGPEIVNTITNVLETEYCGVSVDVYENQLFPAISHFTVPQQYAEEMESMIDGINARAVGDPEIPLLGRNIQYEDLLILNSGGDLFELNCSSFAAWDSLTADGGTVAGRNMDHVIPASFDIIIYYLIARIPQTGSSKLGFVSLAMPGQIGGTTIMNIEGVAAATHDAMGLTPTVSDSLCPQYLLYREAIEYAHSATVVDDIESVLINRRAILPQNMFVCFPSSEGNYGSVVFEYDAAENVTDGVTVRYPDESSAYLVCTNHFRERKDPIYCSRYALLEERMGEIADSDGQFLTVNKAWDMLGEVPIDGLMLYQSVVFEPNKKLIHVAFTQNGQHAVSCNKVTFDLTELIAIPN